MLKISKDTVWVPSYNELMDDIVRCLSMCDDLSEANTKFEITEKSELFVRMREFCLPMQNSVKNFFILNTGLATRLLVPVCNANVIQLSPMSFQSMYYYFNRKHNIAYGSTKLKHDEENKLKLTNNILLATNNDDNVIGVMLYRYYKDTPIYLPGSLEVITMFYNGRSFKLSELDKWIAIKN